MNVVENNAAENRPRINYWRLWVLDAVLVSAGVLFFLATRYGTFEFFGTACLMASLPFVPIMVLVGGAGSTIFALTKVLVEKRQLKTPGALTLLVGPGVLVTLLLVLLGLNQSSNHRLNYICLGKTPASASQVRVAGYSTFLREEWLAVFKVDGKDFETFVDKAKLVPADRLELNKILETSALKKTALYQSLAPLNDAVCYRRVFKEGEEHERGGVFAACNPTNSAAIVLREYKD